MNRGGRYQQAGRLTFRHHRPDPGPDPFLVALIEEAERRARQRLIWLRRCLY